MLLMFCWSGALTWAKDVASLDMDALARSGAASAERLRTSPASWTVDNTLGSGAVISTKIIRAGGVGANTGSWRATFDITNPAGRVQALQIISRDGLWYATDKSGSCKYRPYELPTESPFMYLCLERCTPLFVTPDRPLTGAMLEGVKDHIATFRLALDADSARFMQAVIDNLHALQQQSGKPLGAELDKQLADLKDFLANGMAVRVDVSTGQIIEFGAPKLRTRISGFRFLPHADPADFAVADRPWQDYSDDPTAGTLDDLIMIGHYPPGRVGNKNYDLDGRLMDVKTGRFRRLAFEGGVVMPGCFLKDRRAVIVGGMDSQTPAIRPYEIDLKTGRNRLLGGALLQQGFTLIMDLSPDGKTLALFHSDPAAGLLHGQVFLLDIKSGVAKPIGKPIDTGFLNWTADGQHIVLLDRKSTDLNSPSIGSLAIMDMEGRVNLLRRGNFPVLLADRQTILFEDSETTLWHTCDLKGQDDKLFGDGLKGYGFPAPAPDGKRILMMKFEPGKLPLPIVLPIGESKGQVITNVPGLWGMPAWR